MWRDLLEFGDRTLLAKFLTYAGTGDKRLNALSEPDLAASIAQLVELIPAGSPEHVDLVRHVDTRAELAGIAVPTLVIAATTDHLASPALSRALAAGIPGAQLREIDAGHGIGVEARDEWLTAIQTFLAALH